MGRMATGGITHAEDDMQMNITSGISRKRMLVHPVFVSEATNESLHAVTGAIYNFCPVLKRKSYPRYLVH